MLLSLPACGNSGPKEDATEQTEIQVFIAASLHTVMEELAASYQKEHPEVELILNADSSGTLMTQIEEGYACDIFFSAAQKQMDQLEADGLLIEGSRTDVVNNQVVVITQADNETCKVTGLESIQKAENLAIAAGSVPVGKYTRQALVKLGYFPEFSTATNKKIDVSQITTEEVSEALGGVEISEQANVSKVLTTIAEGSCEVGTVYYSDIYGFEDQVKVLETVPYDQTGDVIYPVAMVKNDEADEAEVEEAKHFLAFLTSDAAKEVFKAYYFDTNVDTYK